MEGNNTFLGIFFQWWYRETFPRILLYQKRLFLYLCDFFSVIACLNTLFDPWKRDQIGYRGLGIKERFEAVMMNLSARLIGAIVKIFALTVFLVSALFVAVSSFLFLLIWLFYPLACCALLLAIFFNV